MGGRLVLINVAEDPALLPHAETIVVKDPALHAAEVVLKEAEDTLQWGGSSNGSSDFKKVLNTFYGGAFGFIPSFVRMYVDIRDLLRYSRNCRWALETLKGGQNRSPDEIEKICDALDFDGDKSVQYWEVRIIFERANSEEQNAPAWLQELFTGEDGVIDETKHVSLDSLRVKLLEQNSMSPSRSNPHGGASDPLLRGERGGYV